MQSHAVSLLALVATYETLAETIPPPCTAFPFTSSFLSIIPLAKLLGDSTEQLAIPLGQVRQLHSLT